MPKVSIIIPAYNVEKYISAGIESACHQTEKDIEVVIVDDGSTDGTWSIIQQYAKQDKRILAFHKENGGVSSARNKALEMASGDYVLFLDSDDWLEENAVEVLLQNADPFGNVLVCSECFFVYIVAGETRRKRQGIGNENAEYSRSEALCCVEKESPMTLSSSCYKLFSRKKIAERGLRFDENIHQGEDALFTFEYLLGVETVKYFNMPLWNTLKRPDSTCRAGYTKRWNSAIESIDKMLLHKDELSPEVVFNLMAYKGERAMWLEKAMLRSKHADRQDYLFAKKNLKEYSSYLIQNRNTLKARIQCMLLVYMPVFVLRPLLKLSDYRKRHVRLGPVD